MRIVVKVWRKDEVSDDGVGRRTGKALLAKSKANFSNSRFAKDAPQEKSKTVMHALCANKIN